MATKTNIEAFQARRAELEKQQAQTLSAAQQRAAQLEGMSVTITSRSGTEGKLLVLLAPKKFVRASKRLVLPLKRKKSDARWSIA